MALGASAVAWAQTSYPVGTPAASEPSGMAPPSANVLAGYTQSYVQDFAGSSLPAGWGVYSGQPGGDTGALFGGTGHVSVHDGVLDLATFVDPALGGVLASGGTCYCTGSTYGAWFVRSRVTGVGPTQVELLWPDHGWPPEVDFNESGGSTTSTSATLHWGTANSQDQRKLGGVDLTKWHTWGVVWAPGSVTYLLDGAVWGSVSVPSEVPSVSMHLSLQQQTWCHSGWACPTGRVDMLVDWVASYAPSSSSASATTLPVAAPSRVTGHVVSASTSSVSAAWSARGGVISQVRLVVERTANCTGPAHSSVTPYSPALNVTSGVVKVAGANWFAPASVLSGRLYVTNATGTTASGCLALGRS